jgi:hypothetical protein
MCNLIMVYTTGIAITGMMDKDNLMFVMGLPANGPDAGRQLQTGNY